MNEPKRKWPYEIWGVECRDGWKKLYEPLVEECRYLGVEILQIKEKFGGLRFYISDKTTSAFKPFQTLRDHIDEAEHQSYKTCEECGEKGFLRTDRSWIKTLCNTHAEVYDGL